MSAGSSVVYFSFISIVFNGILVITVPAYYTTDNKFTFYNGTGCYRTVFHCSCNHAASYSPYGGRNIISKRILYSCAYCTVVNSTSPWVAAYSSNNTSESSAFATLAAAGLVTTGITLVIVGGKKKKDEEEE